MKMTKIIRKLMTGLGAAVLTATLAASSIPAQAAGAGTITVQPKLGETQLGSSDYKGTFDVYKVAEFDPSAPSITYVEPFTSYNDNASYNTIDKVKDSATFTQLVKAIAAEYDGLDKSKLTKAASSVGAGGSTDSIDFGLYLVAQSGTDSNYYDVSPFLVFLPQTTGAVDTATATAYPKLEKKTTPPDDNPPGDDNPPKDNPPKTPPTTPPETPEEETPETPTTPGEDIGAMGDDGMMTDGEGGMMTDAGAMTGDNSQMTTYAAVAGVAAVALIGWFVWKRKKEK